jgi:hypothetical protein
MKNFQLVNEPYECVMLLERMNNLISTLSQLTDEGYYMDYIFNRGTLTEELLKDIGITEEYISNTLDKFEKLRIALFGDCIDWEGLVQQELRAVAKSEREQNKWNDDYIRKLEYKIKQLEGKQ